MRNKLIGSENKEFMVSLWWGGGELLHLSVEKPASRSAQVMTKRGHKVGAGKLVDVLAVQEGEGKVAP